MHQLRLLSAAEQVAEHLLTEIKSGHFAPEFPGAIKLSKKLGVNHKTMESALQILEKKTDLDKSWNKKKQNIK